MNVMYPCVAAHRAARRGHPGAMRSPAPRTGGAASGHHRSPAHEHAGEVTNALRVRVRAGPGSRRPRPRVNGTLRAVSTVPSSEACAWWWTNELPPLAAADLAMKLGWQFGEAALASGEVGLALAWARAFRVDTVNGRSTALGHLVGTAR